MNQAEEIVTLIGQLEDGLHARHAALQRLALDWLTAHALGDDAAIDAQIQQAATLLRDALDPRVAPVGRVPREPEDLRARLATQEEVARQSAEEAGVWRAHYDRLQAQATARDIRLQAERDGLAEALRTYGRLVEDIGNLCADALGEPRDTGPVLEKVRRLCAEVTRRRGGGAGPDDAPDDPSAGPREAPASPLDPSVAPIEAADKRRATWTPARRAEHSAKVRAAVAKKAGKPTPPTADPAPTPAVVERAPVAPGVREFSLAERLVAARQDMAARLALGPFTNHYEGAVMADYNLTRTQVAAIREDLYAGRGTDTGAALAALPEPTDAEMEAIDEEMDARAEDAA